MTDDVDSTRVWKMHAFIPSVSGLGDSRVDAVIEELEARGWSENDQFAVRLALTEALENAVEHGNHRIPEKNIELNVEINGSKFFASVSDEGAGFCTHGTPDPTLAENIKATTGRGIFLIRNYMTKVWYNESGNTIYMEKIPIL